MSYDITIARISNDLKTSVPITKEEWEGCTIFNELEFKEKETYPNYYLEVQIDTNNEYIPCFWISNDFRTASIDSMVFLLNNEIEKYAIAIASKLDAIVFGQEGELFYIPSVGKIESDKKLLEQKLITITELKENKLNLANELEIFNYIQIKIKKASS
jgi:hypothetical protein